MNRGAVIVTGARGWTDYRPIAALLTPSPEIIFEGGASGADASAPQIADGAGIKRKQLKADWSGYGRRAGPMRNTMLIKCLVAYAKKHDCDRRCLAFPDRRSVGTWDLVDKAAKQCIQCLVFVMRPDMSMLEKIKKRYDPVFGYITFLCYHDDGTIGVFHP